MTTTFIIVDHNIIKYANRPFDILDENCVIDNAKLMIERHNAVVSDDDIVLMVGDLSASLKGRQEHFAGILQMLKGKKILVRGNHDYEAAEFYINAGFIDVVERLEIGDTYICHYPCYESRWTKSHENNHIAHLKKLAKQGKHFKNIIHGHIHNKDPNSWAPDGYNRLNVCVDFEPNQFYPVEIVDEQVVDYFINR